MLDGRTRAAVRVGTPWAIVVDAARALVIDARLFFTDSVMCDQPLQALSKLLNAEDLPSDNASQITCSASVVFGRGIAWLMAATNSWHLYPMAPYMRSKNL